MTNEGKETKETKKKAAPVKILAGINKRYVNKNNGIVAKWEHNEDYLAHNDFSRVTLENPGVKLEVKVDAKNVHGPDIKKANAMLKPLGFVIVEGEK